MKITRVDGFLMSCPLPQPLELPFYGGVRTIVKRDAMLIRVETDDGLVGYAPGQGSEAAHRAICDIIGPFLAGRTLADPDALRVIFSGGPGCDPALQKVYCSVEVALYDLLGKAMGVPVSELLGGRVRDRIRLYGSAGMYMTPEGFAEEAAAIAALGFPAYKMRPALGPERDLETVRLIRKAVGPEVEIMVDAHAWWRMGDRSYSAAIVEELAHEFDNYRVFWLEEPLPPDDHEAYTRLHEKGYVRLASGEHEPSDGRFLHLIHSEAVDYVQMDLVCQGGYSSGRLVLTEVTREGLRFAFHSWGTALEIIAAAHLGVCWPEMVVEWLEHPCYSAAGRAGMYPFPAADEILSSPLEIRDGWLEVPKSPGLGVQVDERVIQNYPWQPGPWTWFTLESPPERWYINSDHSVKWTGKA